MAAAIDKLPEVERQEVVNALLAGKPLREVAKLAGVSHQALSVYKRDKLIPTLQAAQKVNALRALAETPAQQTQSVATLTRAALSADPILARIAQHQNQVDSKIAGADPKGTAALISADLKGLELSARLTGLLDTGSSVTVNANFVLVPTNEQERAVDATFSVEE
jgi:transcriptional regulator with XRE-family HTH domain